MVQQREDIVNSFKIFALKNWHFSIFPVLRKRKYLDLDELTPTVLNDMVKAVYVHAPDKSSGHREQQIDISYDLVGILPASLLYDLQNGETA